MFADLAALDLDLLLAQPAAGAQPAASSGSRTARRCKIAGMARYLVSVIAVST